MRIAADVINHCSAKIVARRHPPLRVPHSERGDGKCRVDEY
jgi:hypothetical protein